MRRVLVSVGFLCISLFASRVSAITLAEVGGLDALIAQATQGSEQLPNSGSGSEESWVESVLLALYGISGGLDYSQIAGSVSGGASGNWQEVTGDSASQNLWAYDFGANLSGYTGWFLIKTGNNITGYTHFLYENLTEAQYAVINLNLFGPTAEITKISHIGILPEPAFLSFLAVGLLVVGATSRKRFRR
jgi:hypothetical protein